MRCQLSQSPSVEEVAEAIKKMDCRQRRQLLSKLMEYEGLIEDLSDIADLIRTRDEPSRPFDEFINELRAEGRDIPDRK